MKNMFIYAINGLKLASQERNMGIHIMVAICAITMGIIAGITKLEWAILVLMVCLVLISESYNSAIERLCNFIEPNHNAVIGEIKDLSAGLVLLTAMASIIVAILIFGPYLKEIWAGRG